ncbi:Y-family DNA polymerase [Sphingorhabdus sp.]|uniref:Y-family DNA polymerase n=1 Tax=Sphingorhabdus sp. TaxID=1902408 RepID=UPI00391AB17D
MVRIKGSAPDTPFAMVEKQRGAMRLAACDPAALALGLSAGMALADARARVPDLAVFDHDPAADLELLGWLADGCERYSPAFMIDPPQGLLIDITGCTYHFDGDEVRLAKDLKRRLRRHGLSSRIALGTTPDSARAKARYAKSAIPALPVEALDAGAKVHEALRRAGLKTLKDLACRPRKAFAARFGKATVVKLARLLEEEDARIIPRRHLPVITATQNFAEPVSRTNDVLDTIATLTGKAAVQLNERSQGGRRFEVSLFRSDGHVARLAVDTGAPTRDAGMLMRLIRERIDALSDPLDPGFGYDCIQLTVPAADILPAFQVGLESKVDRSAQAAALIDRLSVRLGSERVRYFEERNSHIPERAAVECAAQSGRPQKEWPQAIEAEPPMRPFRLFETPQRVEALASIPDGPPRQFRWRKSLHHIVAYEGPERIAAEWWRRKAGHEQGKGGPTRDYYRVEDSEGRRFWLFRHGLYSETDAPIWYLHGLFA